MRNSRNLAPVLIVFTALLQVSQPQAAVAAAWTSQSPQPSGRLKVTRPAISFPISPVGDTQIAAVYMALNNAVVPAVYSNEKAEVLYQPPQPLPPGEYDVKCRVVFSDGSPCDQEWRFTISPDALSDLPEPTAQQRAVFEAVNIIRRSIGEPPFVLDKALCAAAQAHSHYLLVNRPLYAHEEQTGQPSATGIHPQDRASAFGFGEAMSEDVSQGFFLLLTTPVVGLFDAPYHRVPFLQPGANPIGGGSDGEAQGFLATTLDFGQSNLEATLISPFAGQNEVLTRWNDHESPDPLRIHPSCQVPVGYPIVFVHFGPPGSRIAVAGATLMTAAGEVAEVLVNTPQNDDHLTNAAFVIPRNPLAPNTTYRVSVKAMTDDGLDISRAWDFTTGADSADANDIQWTARFHAVSPLAIETRARRRPRLRPHGGFGGLLSLKIRYDGTHLFVKFPKNITGLQCYVGGSPTLTRSSPPVHEVNGTWQACYMVPASAHTYRFAVQAGTETYTLSGFLYRSTHVKSYVRVRRP